MAGHHPGSGRPRSPETDAAILAAAVALLAESGLEGFTVEAVAARAGVGKPTIYRRHADRQALAEAAIRHAFARPAPRLEPGATPRQEVLALLDDTIRMLRQSPIGPIFRSIIPQLPTTPALGRLASQLGRRRRRRLCGALQRAVEAGEIGRHRDLDALIDGLLGAIYFRYFITRRSLDPRYAAQLFDRLA